MIQAALAFDVAAQYVLIFTILLILVLERTHSAKTKRIFSSAERVTEAAQGFLHRPAEIGEANDSEGYVPLESLLKTPPAETNH